jgi:hypothetical protein
VRPAGRTSEAPNLAHCSPTKDSKDSMKIVEKTIPCIENRSGNRKSFEKL